VGTAKVLRCNVKTPLAHDVLCGRGGARITTRATSALPRPGECAEGGIPPLVEAQKAAGESQHRRHLSFHGPTGPILTQGRTLGHVALGCPQKFCFSYRSSILDQVLAQTLILSEVKHFFFCLVLEYIVTIMVL
jgi:hypothetical protein